MKNGQAHARPKGVTIVGILTLLGAAGDFFFTMVFVALSSVPARALAYLIGIAGIVIGVVAIMRAREKNKTK